MTLNKLKNCPQFTYSLPEAGTVTSLSCTSLFAKNIFFFQALQHSKQSFSLLYFFNEN